MTLGRVKMNIPKARKKAFLCNIGDAVLKVLIVPYLADELYDTFIGRLDAAV